MRCRGMFKMALAVGFALIASSAQAQSFLPVPNSTVRYASVYYPQTNVSAPTLQSATPKAAATPESVPHADTSCSTCENESGMADTCGRYLGMLTSPWQSVLGSDCGEAACGNSCCSPWYARAGGLVMSRDSANEVWLSFDTGNVGVGLLGTNSDPWDWSGGFEVAIGRQLDCNWSMELVYWQPGQMETSATLTNAGLVTNLNTSLDFTNVSIFGTAATDWFDDAGAHQINRRSYFHNLELNFIHASCSNGGCASPCGDQLGCNSCASNWNCSWMAGIRFFRFEDEMNFWTSDSDAVFNYDNDDVEYGVDVSNNLIGFQLGGRIDRYLCGRCLKIWAAPRVGLYGNQIEHRSWVATGDQLFAYDIRSSKTDVSILAQLDVGIDWQISCGWKAYAGYRVVAASGVALVENQVPQFMADTGGIADVDSNGHVLLHGGFAGLEYRF